MNEIPVLLSVPQFCAKHVGFTIGGMKHKLLHRTVNGLEEMNVVVFFGRRLMIDERKFFDWLTGGAD